MQKALLNIKGFDGVVPPDIPHDLAGFATSSLAGQEKIVKRPDTAPPHIMVLYKILYCTVCIQWN